MIPIQEIGESKELDDLRVNYPQSSRTYTQGSTSDLRVPMRRIVFGSGYSSKENRHRELVDCISVYDTTGPYGDPAYSIDLALGIAGGRANCGGVMLGIMVFGVISWWGFAMLIL